MDINDLRDQHSEENQNNILMDSYICYDCGKTIKMKDIGKNMELFCPECNGRLNKMDIQKVTHIL